VTTYKLIIFQILLLACHARKHFSLGAVGLKSSTEKQWTEIIHLLLFETNSARGETLDDDT
jgi:hypothetical protein